jgi:primosomal protein N' (replication factor Y)
VQALIRWDPVGHAERELAERVALRFPPAVTIAEVLGAADAVDELIAATALPPDVQVLGPVPVTQDRTVPDRTVPDRAASAGAAEVRALIRVPRSAGADLAVALHDAQGVRSARKAPVVRVRIDPVDVG